MEEGMDGSQDLRNEGTRQTTLPLTTCSPQTRSSNSQKAAP